MEQGAECVEGREGETLAEESRKVIKTEGGRRIIMNERNRSGVD